MMAVVTRDSTQGWRSKCLFEGTPTAEGRHSSWASRRVLALEDETSRQG